MTNTYKFSAAAAFGAAALFSMLSFGGSAEAANVLSCKGASAAKVASCCEKVVGENGHRPLWMIQAKMNCRDSAIVKCHGHNRCYIVVRAIEGGGGEEVGEPNREVKSLR